MTILGDRIKEGENKELEFKGILPQESIKWLKTIVAFANCSGGSLIVGIDDDRNVIGLPEDSVFTIADSIVNSVEDTCTPQISLSTSVKRVEDKLVIIVDVYPGNNRPYHIRDLGEENGTFVRIAGTTRHADESALRDLRLQGSKSTFDTLVNRDIQVTDERTSRICQSLSEEGGKQVTVRDLINSGIILELGGEYVATNAYALLCHDSPFRYTEVRCAAYKGTDELDFIDRSNYSCPIQDQIKGAFSFIQRNVRLNGKVDGLIRKDVYEVPMESVRELIVNAVQHRSYLDPTRASYIAIFEDRIEFTSPGGLPFALSVDQMKQGRSIHRNPAISKIFRAAGYCEGWANGIVSVFRDCKRYGLAEQIIENSGIDVKVTIFRPSYQHTEGESVQEWSDYALSDISKSILSTLLLDPGLTVADLSTVLNVSKRTIERQISQLKREGLLVRAGSTRRGQWVVNTKSL